MIKKTTTAIFKDGPYAGQYDWQGGIPLSVGESVRVMLDGETLPYTLIEKTTDLNVDGNEQQVSTRYTLELSR